MTPPAAPAIPPPPLGDADLASLEHLLGSLPSPLQPMDLSALDGYLCGVLLQPRPVTVTQWWPTVLDVDSRAAPDSAATRELQQLVLRRHGELDRAIGERQWFDPWIFASDDDNETTAPSEDEDADPVGEADGEADGDAEVDPGPAAQAVLPWVAGFAAAMEHFPQLMAMDDGELVEPMALLFMHFDPDDLEDADTLLAMIETLEPPADLAEAVQDIVRALMLIADVTRPRRLAELRPAARRPTRATGRPSGHTRPSRPGNATTKPTTRTTRKPR